MSRGTAKPSKPDVAALIKEIREMEAVGKKLEREVREFREDLQLLLFKAHITETDIEISETVVKQ